MGWKGTVRSFAAAARAAEREAQRHHKQAMKEQMVSDAAEAVEDWENYVDDLVSIHTEVSDAVDWLKITSTPYPEPPIFEPRHQDAAERALTQFKPKISHFFKGGSEKLKQTLQDTLRDAPRLDTEVHEAALRDHTGAVAEWESETDLAKRLVAGEVDAIKEVVAEMQSLSEDDLIGSGVEFTITPSLIHAKPEIHTDEIIPTVRRKQLASGRLSESKMPAGQFNELYQDYVASVALRVAGDLFHILPLPEIYVTCSVRMLNPQTGHQELTPILSVQFVRNTFMRLNLSQIDPSDSMGNFRHEMKFSRTKGFSSIKPLLQEQSDE